VYNIYCSRKATCTTVSSSSQQAVRKQEVRDSLPKSEVKFTVIKFRNFQVPSAFFWIGRRSHRIIGGHKRGLGSGEQKSSVVSRGGALIGSLGTKSLTSFFRTASTDLSLDRFCWATRFLFNFPLILSVSGPCARLSWPSPQPHVNLPYRIVLIVKLHIIFAAKYNKNTYLSVCL